VPAPRYEFRVEGAVSNRAAEAFENMVVRPAPAETLIVGRVIDESHLHGVLALIRSLGLRVVSMRELE
jgi:hypothetical protein